MTAPYEAPPWRDRGDSQWADYGVNVGHTVYGGIHFHPPATPSPRRNGAALGAGTTWRTAVRSALADLARACGRAAAVMAYLRSDETGKEKG